MDGIGEMNGLGVRSRELSSWSWGPWSWGLSMLNLSSRGRWDSRALPFSCLLRLMAQKMVPAMAARATIPPTTPPAMGPAFDVVLAVEFEAASVALDPPDAVAPPAPPVPVAPAAAVAPAVAAAAAVAFFLSQWVSWLARYLVGSSFAHVE